MFIFLPKTIKGVLSTLFYVLNTIFLTIPIFLLAILKLIVPIKAWQSMCSTSILWLADRWVYNNLVCSQQFSRLNTQIIGDISVPTNSSFLVIANHQSAIDIVIMQFVLRGKIPFLRFFLKQELIFIPFLGIAFWALDFPFMKRFKKSLLEKKPHLKGKDVEATRKACEKFKDISISIVNYVEGTRFSKEKNLQQGNTYKNLLQPRAGGVGYVMTLLGNQINYILDITLSYPDSDGSYWSFATGEMQTIIFHINTVPVTDAHRGNYLEDPKFRASFQSWLSTLWRDKDLRLSNIKKDF